MGLILAHKQSNFVSAAVHTVVSGMLALFCAICISGFEDNFFYSNSTLDIVLLFCLTLHCYFALLSFCLNCRGLFLNIDIKHILFWLNLQIQGRGKSKMKIFFKEFSPSHSSTAPTYAHLYGSDPLSFFRLGFC